MSFFPDITPLVKETKEFNQNQQKIIALLQEQNQLLKQILQTKK
ncbi:MAG: hypothetical protein MRERV_36c033 [Mycoplasmataceae bacterium RV_VA103A]|nr:MAG: hypothetical protein MRERV_36c033 [Mycoplasmataceae bacterium RV_VA103A]